MPKLAGKYHTKWAILFTSIEKLDLTSPTRSCEVKNHFPSPVRESLTICSFSPKFSRLPNSSQKMQMTMD